jgi:hypothetical protein
MSEALLEEFEVRIPSYSRGYAHVPRRFLNPYTRQNSIVSTLTNLQSYLKLKILITKGLSPHDIEIEVQADDIPDGAENGLSS